MNGKMQQPMLLEHLNLNIPMHRKEEAEAFYVTSLGGVLHPRNTNERQIHVNVGLSQFHLPYKYSVKGGEPVERAQVWGGIIFLETSLELDEVEKKLAENCGIFPESISKSELRVVGPFGNKFVITNPLQAAKIEKNIGAHRGHQGGFGSLLSIRRVVHFVKPGHALAVGNFYKHVLGLNVTTSEARAAVVIGPRNGAGWQHQHLEFVEDADAPRPNAYDDDETRSYHVAIYFATHEEFLNAFERAAKHGAVWENKRFSGGPPEFASSLTIEEAEARGQFRVKDLRDPLTGKLGLVLEHEMRSPRHCCCPF